MRVELFDDGVGSVEYISHMGSDLSVVNAARVSFGAQADALGERDIKLIGYLMRHNHTSPFEHCMLTMRFTVPLFIRSQHHRHRTWAYNEISRRYTSVDMEFYEPAAFRKQHKSNRQASTDELINPSFCRSDRPRLVPTATPMTAASAVVSHHKRSLDLYQQLVEAGISREQARGVLPQNLYTQYYGTVNLHNLLKFVSLRQHEGAQWEIQQVAKACLAIAKEHFPESVRAYKEKHMRKQ
jgi:thymidylate synthase (FAD)